MMTRVKDSIDRVLFPIKMIKKLKNLLRRKKKNKVKYHKKDKKVKNRIKNMKKNIKIRNRV